MAYQCSVPGDWGQLGEQEGEKLILQALEPGLLLPPAPKEAGGNLPPLLAKADKVALLGLPEALLPRQKIEGVGQELCEALLFHCKRPVPVSLPTGPLRGGDLPEHLRGEPWVMAPSRKARRWLGPSWMRESSEGEKKEEKQSTEGKGRIGFGYKGAVYPGLSEYREAGAGAGGRGQRHLRGQRPRLVPLCLPAGH
mgnify:CR=1 FL=1